LSPSDPITKRTKSMIVQMPSPPSVKSIKMPVPVLPRSKRWMPRLPRKNHKRTAGTNFFSLTGPICWFVVISFSLSVIFM
jgi:hypothetical protein